MPGKILIVDDDPDFREAMSTLLEIKGYDVSTASGGEEGFLKAMEIFPDLIVLDVMMTYKTEGIDVAHKIQSETSLKGTPVLLTTGIRKDMNLSFKLEPDQDMLPVKEVLEKPVKPEILLSAIERHIKRP